MFVLKDAVQAAPYIETFRREGTYARFIYTRDINKAQRFQTADRALSWLLTNTWSAGRNGGGYASGLRPVEVREVAPKDTQWEEV